MVYYVTYKASRETEHRSQIARQLRDLGCRQIRKSFWEVDEAKIRTVAGMLKGNSPVVMRRIREIRKPGFTEEKECSDLGSLTVVAYRIPKGMKKGMVERISRRAPYIRLCRGVYAFSQHQERFARDSRLADARGFWESVREFDSEAALMPRLVIVNRRAVPRLLEDTRMRVERTVSNIVDSYRALYRKVNKGEIDEQRAVRMARNLRRKFAIAKKVAESYERWLRMDFSSVLVKPYYAIRKVRLLFEEKYATIY